MQFKEAQAACEGTATLSWSCGYKGHLSEPGVEHFQAVKGESRWHVRMDTEILIGRVMKRFWHWLYILRAIEVFHHGLIPEYVSSRSFFAACPITLMRQKRIVP